MHLRPKTLDEDEGLTRTPRQCYLIAAPSFGVFLNVVHLTSGPVALWSSGGCMMWDQLMPDEAVAFPGMVEAMEFANQLMDPPEGLDFIPVLAEQQRRGIWYASKGACVAAGIPDWMTSATEPINTLPA